MNPLLTRLQGTWYRNGPGTFDMGGQPMHVFDGHGLVGRVAISGGRAHFASRFVRTPVIHPTLLLTIRCDLS